MDIVNSSQSFSPSHVLTAAERSLHLLLERANLYGVEKGRNAIGDELARRDSGSRTFDGLGVCMELAAGLLGES